MTITPKNLRGGWLGSLSAREAYLKSAVDLFFVSGQTKSCKQSRRLLWNDIKSKDHGHLSQLTQKVRYGAAYAACEASDYLDQKRLSSPLALCEALCKEGFTMLSTLIAATSTESMSIKSIGKVTTYEQIRDAITNGYPVCVASSIGFNMRPRVDKGKNWGVTFGHWNDAMTLIGVDDDDRRPGCYGVHHWGDVHGKPIDDAPPGGFWIDADVITKMAKMDDAWAVSELQGFPERRS